MFFDSHCHLNAPEFEGNEESIWRNAYAAGVTRAAVVGYSVETSRKALELAERLDGIAAAVGVAPHEYAKEGDGYIETLRELAAHPKAAAIGEAGLEYHYPVGTPEFQMEHFSLQIDLANELDKPLVIHLRDADADFLRILEDNPPRRAILHCFTAGRNVMEAAAERGYSISFSGIVTFKNAKDIQAAAAEVPGDRLLIETDAPYLAPLPFRGKRCEPAMLTHTAAKVAELRGAGIAEIAAATTRNAIAAFGLDAC